MRRIVFSEGEFYHLYNRGVDKRTIFTSRGEYRRFLAYLYFLNDTDTTLRADVALRQQLPASFTQWKAKPSTPLVAIGAFCLMPNHFHLYVTPLVEGGISKFMQRLQTAYTMYFNEKHDRSGALFQGTFKATHIDNDVYARYLFSYIHLNPAKIADPLWKEQGARDLKKLREFVRAYSYSSLPEYLAGKHEITDPSKFPDYFSQKMDLDDHIDTWLELREKWKA
jgi:putative transposase